MFVDESFADSCGYLRNNDHGKFTCDGNSHDSICTFSCNRPGYSLCPGMPTFWTCVDGSWNGPTSPICCGKSIVSVIKSVSGISQKVKYKVSNFIAKTQNYSSIAHSMGRQAFRTKPAQIG